MPPATAADVTPAQMLKLLSTAIHAAAATIDTAHPLRRPLPIDHAAVQPSNVAAHANA